MKKFYQISRMLSIYTSKIELRMGKKFAKFPR